MTDPSSLLPLRPNVGAALFNRHGEVFIGRRTDIKTPNDAPGIWSMPQGGIDENEDPAIAVLRELREEIGTDRAEILGHHPDWLSYELPPELIGRALGGRYRGQRQRWFALRFTGDEADIRLDADDHPEFDAWRWVSLDELTKLEVGFKKTIYATLAISFAPYASRLRAESS